MGRHKNNPLLCSSLGNVSGKGNDLSPTLPNRKRNACHGLLNTYFSFSHFQHQSGRSCAGQGFHCC